MQLLKKITLSLICLSVFTVAKAQLDFTIGTGTTNAGQYGLPTPFDNYYDQSKHQFLFRASELTTAGMTGPVAILAIRWKVENIYTQGPIPDYEIFIGTTTQNDLTSWVPNVNHIVRSGAGAYSTSVGTVSFNLPTPFAWNGTDNIVIQVCTGQPSPPQTCYSYTHCSAVNYETTSFTSTRYYRSDCNSTDLCTSTSYSGTYNSRPNTTFSVGLPCIDTPVTVVGGPDKACAGKPFNLRPANYYANATYSWEYSNNGVAWSNFTGIPTVIGEIRDSIVAPRWYRVTVKCNGNPNLKYTSPAHKVDVAPFYYCYCENKVTVDGGADIGNLTIINTGKFDSVYKKSLLATGGGTPVYNNVNSANSYTSYHDSLGWPCLYRDTTYLFHVTQIHSGGSFETGVVQAYIDYNRDGLYNPNTERIFVRKMDGLNSNPHIVQVTATVPTNAQIGPTGMRVIISKDTVKAAPCDTISGGGEVEDYIVEICHRPCNGAVNAGVVVSTDTSMCAGYEYTLTDTTYEKQRSGFTRAWQVSGDNTNWFNIQGSMNKDTLERVFAGQPLYYRLRTICVPTHDTNYSAGTLINTKPGYKCYCYSKATGGQNYDSSDIGGVTIADYSSNAGGPHLLNALAVKPRTDFTDITPINLFIDSVYQFSVFHTMPVVEHGDAKVTVFMDFNNNHKYDIPEERIYTGYTAIGNHTLIDNVIIPQKAITDVPTGMRVIVNNDVGPNVPSDSACGPYTSGETEDYVLIFRKPWPAGINGQATLTGFNVHPNPTSGKFYVQFSTQAEIKDVQVRVTNVTGQLIQQQEYEYQGGMFYQELDMTGQPAGVYFVELQAEGTRLLRKLVVQ